MPEAPHTLEHEGRTYQAHRFDRGRKKAWAKWVYALYRDVEEAKKERISEVEYLANLDAVDDLYFRGQFGILSERGIAAALTDDGVIKMVSLIFGLDEDEAIALLVAKPTEATALVGTIFKESFPRTPGTAKTPDTKPASEPRTGYIPPRQPAYCPSPSQEQAVDALLIDKFKVTPDQIESLTDKDIKEKYLHPRTKEGAIAFPEEEARVPSPASGATPSENPTPAQQLEAVLALKAAMGGMVTDSSVEAARVKLTERLAGV